MTTERCWRGWRGNSRTESFLIVRYGDHQPQFGPRIIDPSLARLN